MIDRGNGGGLWLWGGVLLRDFTCRETRLHNAGWWLVEPHDYMRQYSAVCDITAAIVL